MSRDKLLSTLSLAKKAGAVADGEFSTEKAVKEKRAYLVLVAQDASDNTKKKMSNMTHYYQVPLYVYADKERLGACIGKEYRSMVAITHPGFSASLIKQLHAISQRNREE